MAVQAASELGEKLILAGEIRENEREFLDREVFPYIDGENIKFIGEVDHEEKSKLYAGAKALLFPIRWNEAFGLVQAEALACGTPIIAFPNGSVPEVIEDGKTGFIVDDLDGVKESIKNINQISREYCRQQAEKRYDVSVMGKQYEELFESLVENHE